MRPESGRKCRVVAVALHDGHVLLSRSEIDDFWTLPGGACRRFETTMRGMQRELREEIGTAAPVGRLIWVAENMGKVHDQPFDNIEFYFEVRLPPEFCHLSRTYRGREGNLELLLRWHRIEELEGLELYPEFLKRGLANIPETTEHIVWNRLRRG